jgi:hypothetical protein
MIYLRTPVPDLWECPSAQKRISMAVWLHPSSVSHRKKGPGVSEGLAKDVLSIDRVR